ncbi:aldo/keto reductase [Brevibacillus laterosporus]|uniref:aldo/keto reductase n=1 Tax=Brevibacillus laterosporus TaxID=1465 RepID=UPI00037AAAD2|nr:aldo/keto reductase [Brevibacillus laterosporus]ATO50333.1 glyoxal reductase [Brevibacillus laterosporus DSM 25]MBG9802948.1 glyoxal reductase [Brevibacillus laterosporus]MED2004966.1 aldo/keto reductase [Brevibacillus laterosporus]MED4764172.1 aldo/keto reductase [Brevibacillus laterosporus]TPH15320.1 aldo/keto reductase [Brevibacillus laterosporus]
MVKHLADCTVLQNGVKMPWIGLGVWRVDDGDQVVHAVKTAIQHGYRSIDTAMIYKNEEGVGQAIAEAGVPREELFITTKVWNSDQGYDTTLAAFDESLKKLGLEYLDLYLIHWPGTDKYVDTWKALEKLYKDGKVRAIGVCNFHKHHLEELIKAAEVKPMVNQIELHPLLTQKDLLTYCKQHNIQVEAWSPLMQGNLDHPVLAKLAQKYEKTPAQIVLRWHLQNGVVIIPKSVNENRIKENAALFGFELTAEDMGRINDLNQNQRFGPNPDEFFLV